MSDSLIACPYPGAPSMLYDEDGREVYLRKDIHPSSGAAKYAVRNELDMRDGDWPKIGAGATWMHLDAQYVAEMVADGVAEPYDGWPWQECSATAPGAVPYWHIYWKVEP